MIEITAGFRPNRFQLLKIGYMGARNSRFPTKADTFAVQLVTTLSPIALARE